MMYMTYRPSQKSRQKAKDKRELREFVKSKSVIKFTVKSKKAPGDVPAS